jgi:hypothetical protein
MDKLLTKVKINKLRANRVNAAAVIAMVVTADLSAEQKVLMRPQAKTSKACKKHQHLK